MATAAAARRLSRVDQVWLALPYALLLASTALTWAGEELAAVELPRLIIGALAVAGWHGWWAVAHPSWLETRLLPMVVYYAGMVALTGHLFNLSFNFFPLYLVCYALAFVALPGWWAYAGVALTTVVALLGPRLLSLTVENVVVTLAGATLAAVAGGSIRALENETRQRKAAMAELASTTAELQRALADNLALQERLVAEAHDSGMTAERTRLAGEIHDTLAAGLGGIVSQLEALDAELGADHPLHRRVAASSALARESLHEARRSVRALRPGPLERGSLTDALDELVTLFGDQLDVSFQVTGDPLEISAPIEDALVRAAHEALINIVRHAGAERAHLTLSLLTDRVALDIADDGVGDTRDMSVDGHGLAIMTERIEAVGGAVERTAAPGGGTVVTVTVPVTGR